MEKYVKVTKTITLGFAKRNNETNTTLGGYSTEEIEYVKQKICGMVGVETNLQNVFFTEKNFENGQVVDYEKKDGYRIRMDLNVGVRMQIHIKVSWSAQFIPFDVHSWNTIADIKMMFKDKEGTPANHLTLVYAGKQVDDSETLEACGIISASTILYAVFLGEEKIEVSVRMPGGETFKAKVKHCSSVENLKTILHCMMGSPVDMQKLTFNGVLLENGHTIADYNIRKGSELELTFLLPGGEVMMIFVETVTEKRLTIYANSMCTVYNVKKKIQYMKGIPRIQQRLVFEGKQLKDDHTLGDYNIQNQSILLLVDVDRIASFFSLQIHKHFF